MELLFKKKHLRKILQGEKTQTRRRIKRLTYQIGRRISIRNGYYKKGQARILITRRFRQRLGDISMKEIRKEGFETFAEFKADWIKNYGHWDPDEVVMAYEYEVAM